MKILYIGLDYHRIPSEICKELTKLGAKCIFYPIKKEKLWVKFCRRVFKKRFKKIQIKHHKKILLETKNEKFDFVFFIQIHFISVDMLLNYIKQFSEARFILYNWDSIEQHNYTPYIDYFDKVYSFDREDTKKFTNITYLPLFYTTDFKELSNDLNFINNKNLLFIGTYNRHQRYELLKKVIKYCKKNNI